MASSASSEEEYHLTDEDFVAIAHLVESRVGIVMDEGRKRNLVYNRLSRRLRALNMNSFAEYIQFVKSDRGKDEMVLFVNALTTNLTRFFREDHHFDHLKETVQAQARSNPDKKLRLWSAGSSSGEEAYSISMTLYEAIPNLTTWDAKILATDIDTNMLAAGKAGIYSEDSLESIPEAYQKKYIMKNDALSGSGKIQMEQKLRDIVFFKQLNLLGNPWPHKGPFDVIFCRNVIIYFANETKKVLINRYADMLKPGGFLYIGHSENIYKISDRFETIGNTIYKRIV